MKINRTGLIVIVAVGAMALLGVGKVLLNTGILGHPSNSVSAIPEATNIQKFTVADVHPSYMLPVTAKPTSMSNCPIMEILAWNATGGLDLANGGPDTTRDSYVEKYTGGGCLSLRRQDDYGQMEANLAKFVQSNGQSGDAFFSIMGDGYPYVAAALQKLIPGQFAAIGIVGFSDGEDQCMVPGEAVGDKQKLRGTLIAAVPRDGDWNICVKLASDNGIPINVNQKTFDPNAMNFVDVDAFTTADEKLIAHYCEDRQTVEGGIAHETKKRCVNGVATWTPGDVDVVSKFSGSIVGAASTHDYQGQMPALIIGSKTWMAAHHDYVVGLLKAADRGAMAVRSGQAGLMQMGAVHSQIFKEQDAAYWAKYFKGDIGQNHAGETVHLGGSKVITLQEARDYLGMRPGTENIYASVYRVFKGYDETFYPTLYPKGGDGSIPAYADVVDTSYLTDAVKDIPESTGIQNASFAVAAPITQAVSKRSWHIEFNTGSAVIKPESMPLLFQIKDAAAVASSLRVRFDGYTDDTGSAARNIPLSQARAEAVQNWLYQQAPNTFPKERMEARGYGSTNAVCSDLTPDCRAQNRRVDILMGQ